MKRLLTFILASVLAVSALSVTASAAYVTMYAQDGRTISVHDSQVQAYKNVGWYTEPFVTMYALDGRRIQVQKSQVGAYQDVGWYTYDDMIWNYIEPKMQSMYNRNDYLSLYFSAQRLIEELPYSPHYTDKLYTYRTRAMDKWRTTSGCPVGVTSYEKQLIEYYNDGSIRVNFNFTNTSYKPIIAIKQEYSICNVFGDILITKTVTAGSNHDFHLAPGETAFGWGLTYDKYQKLSTARFIRNHKVVEVVFADGTKWTNPGYYTSNGEIKNVYNAGYVFTDTGEQYYIPMWVF